MLSISPVSLHHHLFYYFVPLCCGHERPEHVPKYHEWMSSPELRELTASESLTLEEEYEMCASWRVDADKLTFIVLERDLRADLEDADAFRGAHGVEGMIGDVNLFLSSRSPSPILSPLPSAADANADACSPGHSHSNGTATRAELELMIASTAHRGKGLGREALMLFMSYAKETLKLRKEDFFVKVGTGNEASLRLFKKIGFEEFKAVDVFQEIELRWPNPPPAKDGWPWEDDPSWTTSTISWPGNLPSR